MPPLTTDPAVQAAERISIHQQTLFLSTDRCIYWQEQKTLVLSDTHFGKTGHFRKSGIAVPQNIYKEDLQRLVAQVQYFQPEQLVVVGDLFHSAANKELELFKKWRNDLDQLHIRLVKGNHDILHKDWYANASITVSDHHYALDKFCFVHDISAHCAPSENIQYYFSGHIHPCITLKGLGRQSVKLPCYYFGSDYAILPAFGKFTGTALIDRKPTDAVYAILPANTSKGERGAVMKV